MIVRGVDISGQRFGSLVAIEPITLSKNGTWKWRVQCDCGVKKVVFVTALRSGTTRSCGCMRRKNISDKLIKHGLTSSRTYSSWSSMKGRCLNKNNREFKHYGAREISVCPRWIKSFEFFLNDMGERPEGTSIDRVDNDGNYELENCRWATPKQQANNRRARAVDVLS
jgi:hypothetical protein